MTQGEGLVTLVGSRGCPHEKGQHRPCQKVQIPTHDGFTRRKYPLTMGIQASGKERRWTCGRGET